jgi:hypothetical protein
VLAADADSNGGSATVTFTRVIVMPDGHKYIEGVTPKQLPPPSSHMLPNDDRAPAESTDSYYKSNT